MNADSGDMLPDYGKCYLGRVIAEYRAVNVKPGDRPDIEAILKRYEQEPQSMTWADLYMLEKAVLSVQPFSAVKRRAWSLRDKYSEVVGPSEYNAYIASHPPNENEAGVDESEVRADLDHILGALHWSYSLIPLREGLRGKIINRIGWILLTVGCLLAIGVRFSVASGRVQLGNLIVVAFVGCLGGFVSMLRRIGQVPSDGDPLLSIFQLNSGLSTLYLAPVSGAVFSLLLCFIFLGGVLKGDIFPTLPAGLNFSWGIDNFCFNPADKQPVPVIGFAVLLVWSFIAGFAERFVPDILDRLVTRSQTQTQLKPSPAPPFSPRKSSLQPTAQDSLPKDRRSVAGEEKKREADEIGEGEKPAEEPGTSSGPAS